MSKFQLQQPLGLWNPVPPFRVGPAPEVDERELFEAWVNDRSQEAYDQKQGRLEALPGETLATPIPRPCFWDDWKYRLLWRLGHKPLTNESEQDSQSDERNDQ